MRGKNNAIFPLPNPVFSSVPCSPSIHPYPPFLLAGSPTFFYAAFFWKAQISAQLTFRFHPMTESQWRSRREPPGRQLTVLGSLAQSAFTWASAVQPTPSIASRPSSLVSVSVFLVWTVPVCGLKVLPILAFVWNQHLPTCPVDKAVCIELDWKWTGQKEMLLWPHHAGMVSSLYRCLPADSVILSFPVLSVDIRGLSSSLAGKFFGSNVIAD